MNETRLAELFAEFLDAAEEGRDVAEELLARAGDVRADLEAKIRLERDLAALSRELDLDGKTPETPQLIGRFQVLGPLGEGGLSRVYLAFDPELGRRIALKVLHQDVLLDKGQRAWTLNEARSLARISHPGVVRVYEVGETGPQAYVAMELLTGSSLHDVIREWRRLRDGAESAEAPGEVARALAARLASFPARIELLARVAEALAHCHEHGILHRDIKPQNVMFDADGAPKLIDFGLAHMEGADEDSRLGLTQALVGTAAYIAPEQVASDQTGADPRSDQFAFGTVAYECFALENPFARKTRRATLDAIEAAHPPPLRDKVPALPGDLALVVHHALEREPAARYPDMVVLASDLRAVLAHRPLVVREPSLAHVARLWFRRHRRAVTIASVALGSALLLWGLVGVAEVWRAHDAILTSVGEIQPETFTSTEGFVRSSALLGELQRRSRDLDARTWARLLFHPTSTVVHSTVEAWSRALSNSLERETALGVATGIPVQDGIYRELLWQDALLCPDCPYNRESRLRGRVLLPDWVLSKGHALDILVSDPSIKTQIVTSFRPAPMVELLVSGTYRLQCWDEGADSISHETVFFVPTGWLPGLRIALEPPRQECLQRTKPVERGERSFPTGERIHVPKFRILEHLVTNAEFDRFRDATHSNAERPGSDVRPAPDASAWVTFTSALAYAQWAGGRLPLWPELALAREHGQISRAADAAITGEFVLDIGPDGGLLQVSFDAEENPHFSFAQRDNLMRETGRCPGFRLVFAADSPAYYREVAAQPIQR